MPDNFETDEHCTTESSFPSQLLRRPIRCEDEEDEEDDFSEEDNAPNSRKKLYPFEELEKINRRTAQNKSERRQKRHPLKRAVDSEEASKFSDYCRPKYIIIFLLAIFSLLYAFFSSPPEKPAINRTVDLTEFITDAKNKFEGQDLQTFQKLRSSLKRVLNENSEPATPSIFTVIANKGAENTASDFSIYIARKLALDHYVSINQSVFHRNPDSLKYDIDTEIKSKFDNRSLNVAVVDRFHNVPIGAAMIFHNYCDHENAPFKRAIFLFIVHLDPKILETSNIKVIDAVAMQALRDIWRDASDDIVDSLITRLTVNVINIK